MAACREHPLDAIAVRLSRRTAVAGLASGFLFGALRDRLAGNALEAAAKRKAARQKRRPKRDRGDKRLKTEIVGGTTVAAGKYPFQVALLDKRNGKKGFEKQFCGGSLIDAWHVLTAAHCVVGRATTRPKNLRAVIGVEVLNSRQGETRQIASITIHPDYDGQTMRNDVAVMRLTAPVDVTIFPAIRPAEAADDELEEPGTRLTVTGWGSMRKHVAGKKRKNKPPKFSHGLREVRLPVVADEECVREYSGKGNGQVSADVMLCAGQPGLDSCLGDSGGPLFASTPGGFVQVGIVSWGIGCAAPNRPGIYTRVSALSDFIQGAIADTPR